MSLLNPVPPTPPQLTEAEALALSETGALPPRLEAYNRQLRAHEWRVRLTAIVLLVATFICGLVVFVLVLSWFR